MQERKLNFKRNEDSTIVEITPELKKKATKIYNNIGLNLQFMWEQLNKGELNEGMKDTHLSLIEHYSSDFCDLFGYESIQKKAIDERHKEVRGLNEENRNLRKQLGDKVSNEDVRERLKSIREQFKSWWNIEGFGHSSDESFSGYGGFSVRLSGMITDAYYKGDDSCTEEKKIEHLRKIGFTCATDDGKFVIANDDNIELLRNMLVSKFQSAQLIDIKTNYQRGKSDFRDINISIRDLSDFDIKEGTSDE